MCDAPFFSSKSRGFKVVKGILSRFLKLIIRFYQVCISPLFPPCCRYYPTCSNYALKAIEKHGAIKGSFYATKRILRCNPFHAGGYDPVP